jgi:hypothetical protein
MYILADAEMPAKRAFLAKIGRFHALMTHSDRPNRYEYRPCVASMQPLIQAAA